MSPAIDPIDPVDQELAHILLVELLAHQFAQPVQWIETQECLLQMGLQRQIEIGPAATLNGMMRRTIDDQTTTHPRHPAQSSGISLLSSDKNKSDIYYLHDPQDDPSDESPPTAAQLLDANRAANLPTAGSLPAPSISSPAASSNHAAAPLQDASVKVSEVLQTIVSAPLKRKGVANFPWSKSVKALASGRSALENEIVGDLQEEFPSLPDGSSDVPLEDVCLVLEKSFKGRPGKKADRLISRFVSAKLPSGFDMKQCSDYLSRNWGFESGRRDSILLAAVLEQPDARLSSEAAAKEFLDSLAQQHVTTNGLQVNRAGSANVHSTVDPALATAALEQQRLALRKNLKRQAQDLDVDLDASLEALTLAQTQLQELQSELDVWQSEHGFDYANGIKGRFNEAKIRRYDSSWHWHKQHALRGSYRRHRRRVKPVDIETQCAKCHPNSSLTFNKNNDAPYVLCHRCTQIYSPLIEPFTPLGVATKEWSGIKEISSPLEILSPRKSRRSVHRTMEDGKPTMNGTPKTPFGMSLNGTLKTPLSPTIKERAPYAPEGSLFIRTKQRRKWRTNPTATSTFLDMLDRVASGELSLTGKNVLLTGAGNNSIGSHLLKALLRAGAQVFVTTSSHNQTSLQLFEDAYRQHCAPGSSLRIMPFNQASNNDVEALVSYIYGKLRVDLDLVFPFAAISESGRGIDNIDGKSELAHRMMSTNALRLVGAIVKAKRAANIIGRPAQVILPLSPNHGLFGNDGLYAESKLALEGLFDKWKAEELQPYLSLCGVIIGWTRGTGLMGHNDFMVDALKALNVQSFSQAEMSAYIMSLTTPRMLDICEEQPLMADFSGNMDAVEDLAFELKKYRQKRELSLDVKKAIAANTDFDKRLLPVAPVPGTAAPVTLQSRSDIRVGFPKLPNYDSLVKSVKEPMTGMHDLDRVVVVTGFAEIGPLGSSRSRWEMESAGSLSVESLIELSWMMGLIKWSDSPDPESTGWKDAKTGETVMESAVRSRYEAHVLEHTGIRVIQDGVLSGRGRAQLHQEITIQADLDPFETSKEIAQRFKHTHGDKAAIHPSPASDKWSVTLKNGATLFVPRDNDTLDHVGGCIPDGWDALAYGIDQDIVSRVDRVTLYLLVTVVDALLSAGIRDVYEIYKHIHTSQLANLLGSGVGAGQSIAKQYKDQYFGETIGENMPSDLLQETFVNTPAAWINMLLLSSTGATHTPVGACATALESLDAGADLIRAGKARLCVVGGFEDIAEEAAHGFERMKATVDVRKELAAGRRPAEMSRPMAASRSGFVEASGAGAQIICSASLAIEMGLPIYGVVAFTGMAADGISSSVPAPGKGILGFAAETPAPLPPRMLDPAFRRRRLDMRRRQIDESRELDLMHLDEDLAAALTSDPEIDAGAFKAERRAWADAEAVTALKDTQHALDAALLADPAIAPLRGALAVWGLTPEDLTVAVLHATSTVKGDLNEAATLHAQLTHLRRAPDLPVQCVCPKALTGHGKGASGAWSVNTALQVLGAGVVPPNRNLDDVDPALRAFDSLLFPRERIDAGGPGALRAASVTSFGFGQKGAQVLLVAPQALLAGLAREDFDAYALRVRDRQRRADRRLGEAMVRGDLVRVKTARPFVGREEAALLDRNSRLA